MWNNDKSLTLSILSVRIFFIIAIIFCLGGYPIANQYVTYIHRPDILVTLLITGYICLILAFFIFIELHQLLMNIKLNRVFNKQNIAILRKISWLCMCIAIVTCCAIFQYPSFLLVSIVFAFISLILRVVKNVMSEATRLKQENDFTI